VVAVRFTFLCSIAAAVVISFLAIVLWSPPIMVLLVNIAFYAAFSLAAYLVSDRIFWSSIILSIALGVFVAGIVGFPHLLAFEARTPEDHFIAARSLTADWRMPFNDEAAAWPHYLLAAEGRVPEAECVVGMAYLYRHYKAPFDRAKARYWLERAASDGSTDARRQLGDVDTIPGV
jgi:hypothetical protein